MLAELHSADEVGAVAFTGAFLEKRPAAFEGR